ncbi:MAG: hypothetical protein ABI325_14230 [Ginsengibacter sp.]
MKYKNKNEKLVSHNYGLADPGTPEIITKIFLNMSLIKDAAVYFFHYLKMKNLINFSFTVIMIVGCKERTGNDIINTAAIHFAGVFITENIQSGTTLRIEGRPDVKKETDSTYYVSGLVEEFSPVNYPVSVKHFNETLWYSESNPNNRES